MRLFLPLLIVFFISCNSAKKNEALITGDLSNGANKKIYFECVLADKDSILDSAVSDGRGKFELENSASKLDYYLLRSDDRNVAYLILKGGETIHITGDAKNLDKTYAVTGSQETNELLEFRKFERHLSDSLNVAYTSARNLDPAKKNSVGMELQKKYEKIMRDYSYEFINRHPTSIVSLSASQYMDKMQDISQFEKLDSVLSLAYPDNLYVQEFAKQVEDLKRLPVGSEAPEIKSKAPNGKEISLASLRGKVVLIDFWASWCEPCRKESPRMVEIYDKFKGNNFEMLGVSLDEKTSQWKEAILHDHLAWPQVCEQKKWESKAVNNYFVSEIPYTVLVDRNGRIVAKGLHGAELEVSIQKAIEGQ